MTLVSRCIETNTFSGIPGLQGDRPPPHTHTQMPSDLDATLIVFADCFQIFEGNSHYDTPEVRRFEELVAQYIRVFPERWSPAGIGMRLEILGCELPGENTGFHI